MCHRRPLSVGLLLFAAAWWSNSAAGAPLLNWDPGATGTSTAGGTGVWNTTSAFWYNSTTASDAGWVTSDDAAFGGTAGGTVTLSGSISAADVIFNTSGYTITGSTLALTAGTINAVQNATIGSALSGSAGVTKLGTGTLTLTSSLNSFTGGLSIVQGQVFAVGSKPTLGGSGTLTLGDTAFDAAGVTLTLANTGGGPQTFANPIVVQGGTTGGIAIQVNSGYETFSGPVTLNNNTLALVNNNATAAPLVFTGGFSGTGSVTANGTVTISGSNGTFNPIGTFTNSSTSAGGKVTIDAPVGANVAGIIENGASPLNVNQLVTVGSNNLTLTAASTGTLTLGGGVSGTGNLTLNVYSYGGSIVLSGGTVNNVGTITNSGYGAGTASINAAVGSNVTGIIQSSYSPLNVSGLVTVGSNNLALTTNSGGTLTLGGGVSGTGNLTLNVNNYGGAIVLSGGAVNNVGSLINSAASWGTTLISAPVGSNVTGITQNGASNLNVTGVVTVGPNNLVLTTAAAGTITLGGGVSGTGNLVLNVNNYGGAIVLSGAAALNNVMIFNSGNSSGTATISVPLASSVAGIVENSATSELVLGGTGTLALAGTTSIIAGSLLLANPNGLPNSTVNVGVTNGLLFGVNAATIGGLTGNANLALNNGANPVALTVGTNNANTIYFGSLTGSGSLIKAGTGILTLAGSSYAYGGTTTLNAGGLVLDSTSGPVNISVAGGTVLGAAFPINQAFLGVAAPSSSGNAFVAALNTNSGNALNFAAAGLMAVSLGAVGTQTYSGVLTPAGPAYLLGGGGGTLVFQSQLTGSSNSLVVGGALGGTVVLANTADSFGGGTSLGAGVTLSVPSDAVLGPTSSGITFTGNGALQGYGTNVALSSARLITINSNVSGSFNVLPGATLSIPGAITGAGSLVKVDSGTLNLSGANTFTGGVLVSAGTLNISGANTYAGGAAVSGGMLNVSGTNTFPSGVAISAGTLQLGSVTALNAANFNAVSFSAGATGHLQLNGNSVTISGLSAASATAVVENASPVPATLTLNNAGNPTFAGILQNGAGGGPLTVATAGTALVQLNNTANTFTGGLNVTAGTVGFSATASGTYSNLGAGPITLNGVLSQNSGASIQITLAASEVINVASSSGLDVPGTAWGAKILFAGANQITGNGPLTKTGGGDIQMAYPNPNYSGNWVLAGGQIEVQAPQALGTGPVAINNGAELDLTSGFVTTNAITVNAGGILATEANTAVLTGAVNFAAAGSIGLRQGFATGNAESLAIGGALSGSGNMTLVGPTAGIGILTLGGSTAGYAGNISVGAFTCLALPSGATVGNGANTITLAGANSYFGLASDGNGTGVPSASPYPYVMPSNALVGIQAERRLHGRPRRRRRDFQPGRQSDHFGGEPRQ